MEHYNLLNHNYNYYEYYFWFFGLINNITIKAMTTAKEKSLGSVLHKYFIYRDTVIIFPFPSLALQEKAFNTAFDFSILTFSCLINFGISSFDNLSAAFLDVRSFNRFIDFSILSFSIFSFSFTSSENPTDYLQKKIFHCHS